MDEKQPAYCVIVPTHDRPDRLARCLAALARLDPPAGGFEVIVVDDGGARPAGPIVRAADRGSAMTMEAHRQPNTGPAAARNAGARLAHGQRLAFTDDDCEPCPRWLTAMDRAAAENPGAMLGGRAANACRGNAFSEASQLLIDFLQRPGTSGEPSFVASNNLCVPGPRFEEIGGFDTRFPLAAGEDRELCDRWIARGWPVRIAAGARIDHHHRLGPIAFWRQHRNYGRGAYRVWALRRRTGPTGHAGSRLAGLGFYRDLVRYPLSLGRGADRWAQAALLAVAQAATAAGFLREKLSRSVDIAGASADPSVSPSSGRARSVCPPSTKADKTSHARSNR